MRSPHGDQINNDPIVQRMQRLLVVATMIQLLICLVLFLRGAMTPLQQSTLLLALSILLLALSIQAGVLLGVVVQQGTIRMQQGTIRRLIAMAKSKVVTKKKFKAAMGRDPIQDELERCNCALGGSTGHWGCGWCEECNKPRYVCSHLPRPPLSNIVTVAPVRMGSDAPRGPEGPKVVRPMTEVEKEIARADMAFLIAKEKESGDWDKWQDSQKHWRGQNGPLVDRDIRTGRFRARGDR